MRYYKCTDIQTVDGKSHDSHIVTVPEIDLDEAVDRYENLVAVSGVLEGIVGEVESFSYKEVSYAD